MPCRRQKPRAWDSKPSAAACRPWCTCSATTRPGQRCHAASSKAVESAPALYATATSEGATMDGSPAHHWANACSQGLGSGAAMITSAFFLLAVGLGVGVAAVAVEARVAAVHQLLDLEIGHLAPSIGQPALEKRGHLLVVAG